MIFEGAGLSKYHKKIEHSFYLEKKSCTRKPQEKKGNTTEKKKTCHVTSKEKNIVHQKKCPTGSCNVVGLWKNLLVLIYSKLHEKNHVIIYTLIASDNTLPTKVRRKRCLRSSETWKRPPEIVTSLRKSSEVIGLSSEIFGKVRVVFGNFRTYSGDLRKSSKVFGWYSEIFGRFILVW